MFKTHLLVTIAIVTLGSLTAQAAKPQVIESAQWLPDSCTAMISVTSAQDLKRDFQKTPFYALLQSPAMKPVIEPVKAKLQENIKKELDELWKDLEIRRPPKSLPRPQGRIVFGVELKEREFEVTYAEDEDDVPEPQRVTDMDWQFVLVAEMGEQTEATDRLLKQLIEAAREGDMIHRHRPVGPTQLHWFVDDADDDPDYDTPCVALQGQHLVLSTSARLAEQTLKNIKRSGPSMAQSKVLQSMARQVHDGGVTLVVEADPIRKVMLNLLPDQEKYQTERVLDVLGIQALQGLISSLQWRHQGQEVLCIQTLIATDGPPQGVLALLCPDADELKLDCQALESGVAVFGQSHLNPAHIYEQVVDMGRQIGGVDLNFFVQTALSATGGQQAPVDLKRDILDHMAPPLTTRTLFKQPLTQPDQARDVITIPLRNNDAVDTALARIHQTYLADLEPELQRQMLDHTLYLLPAMELDIDIEDENMNSQVQSMHYALGVINNELVFGRLDDLEQLIRATREQKREGINQDPVFKQVRRYLPSQASQYSYANLRLWGEYLWELSREGLKAALNEKQMTSPEDMNDLYLSPAQDLFWELSDLVQPSVLPPFSAISQYFGAAVSYGKRTDQGIFSETLYLRVPNAK